MYPLWRSNVVSMLGHLLRRQPNIAPTLAQHLVFTWKIRAFNFQGPGIMSVVLSGDCCACCGVIVFSSRPPSAPVAA